MLDFECRGASGGQCRVWGRSAVTCEILVWSLQSSRKWVLLGDQRLVSPSKDSQVCDRGVSAKIKIVRRHQCPWVLGGPNESCEGVDEEVTGRKRQVWYCTKREWGRSWTLWQTKKFQIRLVRTVEHYTSKHLPFFVLVMTGLRKHAERTASPWKLEISAWAGHHQVN